MLLISWIQGQFLRRPPLPDVQDWARLGADIRKLKADAETLRMEGKRLRREIAAALAAASS